QENSEKLIIRNENEVGLYRVKQKVTPQVSAFSPRVTPQVSASSQKVTPQVATLHQGSHLKTRLFTKDHTLRHTS
ncbi:hypothetical protein GIB67_010217, partial [Kingdonia uniflora]